MQWVHQGPWRVQGSEEGIRSTMEESLKLMIEYSISPLYQWTTNIINYPLRLPSWLKSEYPMKLNPIQKYSDVNDILPPIQSMEIMIRLVDVLSIHDMIWLKFNKPISSIRWTIVGSIHMLVVYYLIHRHHLYLLL